MTATATNSPSTISNATMLHEQMQQDLVDKFGNIMTKAMLMLQQDFHHSFTKLNSHYDNLSDKVKTLNKQYQCLQSIISTMQVTHPSPSLGGDGHA